VDKVFADHKDSLEYVMHMKDLMEERKHETLYNLLLQVIAVNLPLDEDAPQREQIDVLEQRSFAVSMSLLAYSCTIAAHEASELNEQYA
jgi:hypothetical protein